MDFEEHNTKKRSLGHCEKSQKQSHDRPISLARMNCSDTLWK